MTTQPSSRRAPQYAELRPPGRRLETTPRWWTLPRVAAYFDSKAALLKEMGRFREALEDATVAVSLAPKSAYVYHTRAGVRRELKDLTGSVNDYSVAIQIAPQHSFRYYDRGTAFVELGQFKAAISDLDTVLRMDPAFVLAKKWRGISYSRLGDRPNALRDLKEYILIDPSDKIVEKILNENVVEPYNLVNDGPSVTDPLQALPPTISNNSGRRVALVIGNTNYQQQAPLINPVNDANLIASSLRSAGFQSVTLKVDLSYNQLVQAIRDFAAVADDSDWSVIYYSGHGVAFNGTNYMIPVDARLKADRDIDIEAVDIGKIYSAISGSKKLRLVILDMCRSNPFAKSMTRTIASRSLGRGLAPPIESEAGELTVFSAKDGQEALDGEGKNSPFAEALARRITSPKTDVRRIFDRVRDDVLKVTDRKQQPFSYGSLPGDEDFYFFQ